MFLVKSIEKKHKQSFLNGNIHFTNYKKFREIEKERIGDPQEVKISKTLNKKNDIIINNEIKTTTNEIEINLEPNFTVPMKIDCYSLIDDKYINIKYLESNIKSVNLSSEYFKDLEKLEDDRAILICTNGREFLKRLQKNTNSNIKAEKVKYYKHNEHPFFKDINKMSFKQKNQAAIKSLFLKNQKYEKQKEYRIVAINLEDDFIKNVQLNDIFIDLTDKF